MKKSKMLSMLCVVVLVVVFFSGSVLAVDPVPVTLETPDQDNLRGTMVLQLKMTQRAV